MIGFRRTEVDEQIKNNIFFFYIFLQIAMNREEKHASAPEKWLRQTDWECGE